jgi:hypothetical protein
VLSRFNIGLEPQRPDNLQIGDPRRYKDDSDFEALFFDRGFFYVIRESAKTAFHSSYHAIINQIVVDKQDYQVIESCPSELWFQGRSKGIEGAIGVHDLNYELVILALCEANYCLLERKSDV